MRQRGQTSNPCTSCGSILRNVGNKGDALTALDAVVDVSGRRSPPHHGGNGSRLKVVIVHGVVHRPSSSSFGSSGLVVVVVKVQPFVGVERQIVGTHGAIVEDSIQVVDEKVILLLRLLLLLHAACTTTSRSNTGTVHVAHEHRRGRLRPVESRNDGMKEPQAERSHKG